jgi:hypothetical protein
VFNASPLADRRSALIVFIVLESPTSGISTPQFHAAIDWIRDHPLFKVAKRLKLVGPMFSGSLDSLAELIMQRRNKRDITGTVVASGSVTIRKSIQAFETRLKKTALRRNLTNLKQA